MAIGIATGEKLQEWLAATGIVLEGQHARRVLIDITVGHPTRVYIEQFGDEKLFEVKPPDFSPAEIVMKSET